MKKLLLFIYAFLILSPLILDSERRYLSINEKYKNRSSQAVYLILKLLPGETFKNKSPHKFDVLREHELLNYTSYLRTQTKIDSIELELKRKNARMDSLIKKYEAVK